jgi:hypothetical protein
MGDEQKLLKEGECNSPRVGSIVLAITDFGEGVTLEHRSPVVCRSG